MNGRETPRLDPRRAQELRAELIERAQAWMGGWNPGSGGFGRALLDVAARFGAQVTERLDRAGEKLSLGLLDWLAVRGKAALPARMPVAFKLADSAGDVLAAKPVRLQASVDGASVVFETEGDVKLVKGSLSMLVGVDAAADEYFLPPPGLSSLDPLPPRPDQWTAKNSVSAGETRLQLDPALGIEPGTLIELGAREYRVISVNGDLVEVEPGLGASLATNDVVTRIQSFHPFGGVAHNWQEHAVYLGDDALLNLEAAATIEVRDGEKLGDASWEYWGLKTGVEDPAWIELAHDTTQVPGAVRLVKPEGSVEPRKIDRYGPSRWIRARITKAEAPAAPVTTDSFQVLINPGAYDLPCPESGAPAGPGAVAEAFTNFSPIEVNGVFFPFGREPRQFDTFYLGSADAFSKDEAKVAICFELADVSANSFGVLRTSSIAHHIIASISQDSSLHIYAVDYNTGTLVNVFGREPLQPPRPAAGAQAAEGSPIALVRKPTWRPPLWSTGDTGTGDLKVFIGTAAGATVWIWAEIGGQPAMSGWLPFGQVAPPVNSASQITGLVYLDEIPAPAMGTPAPKLYAVLDGKLYVHSADAATGATPWTLVTLHDAVGNAIPGVLESIVPVHARAGTTVLSTLAAGMAGLITNSGKTDVFVIAADGQCKKISGANGAVKETLPAAASDGATKYVFWQEPASPARLIAVDLNAANNVQTTKTLNLIATAIRGGSLEIAFVGAANIPTLFATGGKADNESWLISWTSHAAGSPANQTKLPSGQGPLGGAPSVLDRWIVAPGSNADAWVTAWDPNLQISGTAALQIGIVTNSASIAPNDFVLRDTGDPANPETAPVGNLMGASSGRNLFSLVTPDDEFGTGDSNPLLFSFARSGAGLAGTVVDASTLTIGELATATGDWLMIETVGGSPHFTSITRDLTASQTEITLDEPLVGVNAADPVTYRRGAPLSARIAPFFGLTTAHSNKLTLANLIGIPFVFPNLAPDKLFAEAFAVNGNHPTLIALDQNWTVGPGGVANAGDFTFDATTSAWSRQLARSTSNPELAWEYWNGSSWARLEIQVDETLNFQQTGKLRFVVPAAMAPTDVAGKTNHWIRARLVGGDYGREKVTVVTKPDPADAKATIQEVVRDASDFHPPRVVSMRVRFGLEAPAYPLMLVTQDSGSYRDQSDANRTGGALVETFLPLLVLMQRFAKGDDAIVEAPPAVPAAGDCGCAASAAQPVTTASPTEATAPAAAQFIMLGLNAELIGEPVNVLLLVEEDDHDGFAPLIVEALRNNRFERLTVRDTTRALGESGLLSLAFAVKPTPQDLFGSSLSWLRLRPSRTPVGGEWKPRIRGAYLNAAWARAAETLTREPLGSSDGQPGLTVLVARPPLLHGTLELRVLEPLDDEERNALEAAEPGRVKSTEPDLPGHWVLWKQVVDPADQAPDERVYSLDETAGEIRFGDSLHGMIPPIGRDSIVAFTYQRTEPPAPGAADVPANLVGARTALQLVSPVEGVEAAFAADQAAGGTPPEDNLRVLRFGNARLRHRERAIAPQDFEDIALESSPQIAQVRAFRRTGGLRVIVVMRGTDPKPNASRRRELKRLLQSVASPLLGARTDVTIEAPSVRRLRLRLTLRVDTLEDAGALSGAARARLTTFFDSVAGGPDGTGWALGAAPSADDIAFALDETPGLAGIGAITLREVDAQGNELRWRDTVRPDELVMLDADAFRLQFESLEAAI